MNDDVTVNAPTEGRHQATLTLDAMSTREVLCALNEQDALVPGAVAQVLPQLAEVVDAAVSAIRAGGKVHYFGAGTSGRLAVIDAAELLPTFNSPPGLFVAHHAGGINAMFAAVENVEDDSDLGYADAADLTGGDVAVGITASGRTPYVAGALTRAKEVGAVRALITADPNAELAGPDVHLLAANTGPEALTGSTRLKAGTAQKLILNAFSTTVMIKLGRTWSNLMVDVVATNAKLRGRVVRILMDASGVSEDEARAALSAADGQLKPALLSLLAGVDTATARLALDKAHGVVAHALQSLAATTSPDLHPHKQTATPTPALTNGETR